VGNQERKEGGKNQKNGNHDGEQLKKKRTKKTTTKPKEETENRFLERRKNKRGWSANSEEECL